MVSAYFPTFEKLSLYHKNLIEKITNNFLPYSDFYFLSLWVWNVNQTTEVSFLEDNLILKMDDYVTNKPIYALIGNSGYETTRSLFKLLKNKGEERVIKLVPEEVIRNSEKLRRHFTITEDPDNYDYILSAEDISLMKGNALHQKRKRLNKFLRNYQHETIIKTIREKDIDSIVINFFKEWQQQQNKNDKEVQNELFAIKNLFADADAFGEIPVLCVYENQKMIGFSIFELMHNEYAVGSFQKANRNYEGITEFINQQVAIHAIKNGCKYINIEQDLGIPGLRRSKLDYNPSFLKKYIISAKT